MARFCTVSRVAAGGYGARVFTSVLLLAASAFGRQDSKVPDCMLMERDIRYGPYQQSVLDIVMPKEAPLGNRPGVIVIHGGGWVQFTKDVLLPVCLRYVEQGFVCANVEYRIASVAKAPAAVNDVLSAAHWFFQHAAAYHVDTKRIVVTGGSAGGHLCLMVGMAPASARLGPPAKVRAVVNFYGITDVSDLLQGPNLRNWAGTWLPDQPGRMELARRVSPISHVRKGLPPILTIHGDADPTVPYQHATTLTNALLAAGNTARLVTVPGGSHGFPKDTVDQIYQHDVWPFLKKAGVL